MICKNVSIFVSICFIEQDISKCCRLPVINMGDAIEKCHKQIKSFKSHNDKYPAYAHVVSINYMKNK